MNKVEETIRKYGSGSTKIPSALKIEEIGSGSTRIVLDGKKVQGKNMQIDGNAFEGWAIATRVCTNGRVILDVDKKFTFDRYIGKGHLCRFLYRAMRFSQQYSEWFALSDYLKSEVDKFEQYLKSGKYVNNVGKKDAGDKGKYDDENAVEAKLAEDGVLRKVIKSIDIGAGKVYRQLPVGLFSERVAKETSVFTRGKSAIDLWNIDCDEINIVELKTKNKMIGIITEIFFYCNYIYDFVREERLFSLSAIPKGKDNHRGYEEIVDSKIRKVNGIMLADYDNYHPWVNEESLDVLNKNNNSDLNYYLDNYHLKIVID
ncbi:MAG: hypothetical protein K6G03_04295 [Lachnospiraceae bacterium]|nr:hypothetical protein [Lachnospiraceae bacterium]